MNIRVEKCDHDEVIYMINPTHAIYRVAAVFQKIMLQPNWLATAASAQQCMNGEIEHEIRFLDILTNLILDIFCSFWKGFSLIQTC